VSFRDYFFIERMISTIEAGQQRNWRQLGWEDHAWAAAALVDMRVAALE